MFNILYKLIKAVLKVIIGAIWKLICAILAIIVGVIVLWFLASNGNIDFLKECLWLI